jgi:hypothetical protein
VTQTSTTPLPVSRNGRATITDAQLRTMFAQRMHMAPTLLMMRFLGDKYLTFGMSATDDGAPSPGGDWTRTPFPVPAPAGLLRIAADCGGATDGRRWTGVCGEIVDVFTTPRGPCAVVHFGSGNAWAHPPHGARPGWYALEDDGIPPAADDPGR